VLGTKDSRWDASGMKKRNTRKMLGMKTTRKPLENIRNKNNNKKRKPPPMKKKK
jgi:hypothetical protein